MANRIDPPRDDRPDQPREPVADAPGSTEDDPITAALRQSRDGSASAGAALSKRARNVVWAVVAIFAFSIAFNTATSVYLYDQAVKRSVEAAEAQRMNGAAQAQARRALADAAPAQQMLEQRRLFRIPLPTPETSPAFEVIANSASAQVLADMPRSAVVSEDYVALGAAIERFYKRQPVVTQSGPSQIKVTQLCQQYMRVASKLVQDGILPAN